MKTKEASTHEDIAHAEKRRKERIGLATVAFITVNIFISGFFINSILNQQLPSHIEASQESAPRAAIVDQVSLTFPNQTLVQTATKILQQAGYSVDYYPGDNVTVEFYRNLSLHGYKLIILRVHSSLTNPDTAEGPVNIFTSERYDRAKYTYLQLTDQLVMVGFSQDDVKKGDTYFGINPNFVRKSTGRFKNSTIIMMGCDGLNDTVMAKAFIEKGARVYIGVNVPITVNEIDTATVHLLKHFLIEKITLEESVRSTFKNAGIRLLYYPPDAGEYVIEGNR